MSGEHAEELVTWWFRNSNVLPEEGDAYGELAAFGVSYDSSMRDIHLAGIEAQRQRAFTPERARAQNELRNTGKRLLLDLLYFQPDESGFGASGPAEAPKSAEPMEAPDLWAMLVELWDSKPEELPELRASEPFLDTEEGGGERDS
jgi:hypothetical protein